MTFNMYQLNQFLTNSKNITRKNCNIYIYIYYISITHAYNTKKWSSQKAETSQTNVLALYCVSSFSIIPSVIYIYIYIYMYIYIYIYIIYYMYITKKQKISILTITNDDNNLHSNACRKLCRINCPHSVLLSFVPKKSSANPGVLKESVVMFLFPFLYISQ